MNSAVTLFDNGSTRITLRARKPQSARLVVTFNYLSSNNFEQAGWGEDFLWQAGYDVLCVKPRLNQWYQDLSLDEFSKLVMAKINYNTVFSYSISMGAYAAIYFASAIRAQRSVLFSPQYSIDPVITYWDPRWKDFWSINFNHLPLSSVAYPATEYVMVYDPWDRLDRRHVDEIAAAVGPQNIRHIKVVLSGHDTIAMLSQTDVLSSLVPALLDNSAEVPALLSSLSKRRKQTWLYAYSLFWRAFHQNRRVANKTFAVKVYERAERMDQRILSLGLLVVTGGWEEAARAIADMPPIVIGEDKGVDGAVAQVDDAFQGNGAGAGAAVAQAWLAKVQRPAAPPIVPSVSSGRADIFRPSQMFLPVKTGLARLLQR